MAVEDKKYFYIKDGKGVFVKYENRGMCILNTIVLFFIFPVFIICLMVFIHKIHIIFSYIFAVFYAAFILYSVFTKNKNSHLLGRKIFDPIENKMYVMQSNGNELCVYIGIPRYINLRSGYMEMWTAELVGNNEKIYLLITYSKKELEDIIIPFAQWLNIPLKYETL